MIDNLVNFLNAIAGFITPAALLHIAWATLLGILIGALPGLTATMGIALITTLTYKLPANLAILVLICVYVGAIYGGSRTAILINIPGTPANAATTLDGFPLAMQGLAGRAMGVATTGSVLGSLIGMFFLATIAPWLGNYALKFQSFEFFWLAIFGIVISGHLTALEDPIKGWIAGFLGLLVAMVGQEGIHAYERFTYGTTELLGGFALIPAMVGAFGFSEVLNVMYNPPAKVAAAPKDSILPKLGDVLRYWRTIIRSGLIGTFIGIIPGVGEDIGAWVSYAAARRKSKEREKFGKGSLEGLMAAETGNNAVVPGAIIPALTLAIPGSAPAAVLLAAMFIHGLRPGPLIMVESPQFVYQVVAMVFFATLAILIYGVGLTKILLKVLAIPRTRLMPIVFVLCAVGSYAITNRIFDIWVMVGFGILGYILRRMRYPMAPLVLGIILGDLLDKNLRRGLVLTDGDLIPFFTRPICLVLWVITLSSILLSIHPLRRALKEGGRLLWLKIGKDFPRKKGAEREK
ncbi:MAG: tripartite tricarboxylate transporter permease [Desulfobacterota bacterium]|nr:tripartite tricarboxylate transporter permease [Thermodesulfobacteriota bacterium]